ncbi:CHASE2 domain-containing protein [Pelagibius marinus]|uniref:CHASE2 domain-containing protein n=1 Tax=Pelagibius marinus TaxID=2762760 RepID=UPI0018729D83|nr:CHASE2 domain-containing protein [Pelagibius marinus]
MRWIDGLAALVIACLAAYLAVQPPLRGLEGGAYDLLLRARQEIYGQSAHPSPPGGSPVVVVALDRETALRPPFDRLPQELWTPQIAAVMDRVLTGGALVVAQHESFATSGEGLQEGYDADYLAVLARAGKEGRIVLGRRAPAPERLGPLPDYVEAVGGDRNLRRIALRADGDGVLRRAALYESSRDSTGTVSLNPSLALELAARVVGERPHLLNGDALMLGRYAVPGSDDNAMLLNFQGGDGGIPMFSLGDLYACAEEGEETFFRKHFDNRVVLFGRSDAPRVRKVTAARFLDVHNADRAAARCRLPVMQSLLGVDDGATTPEVVVTALAVRNLLQRDAVKTLPLYAAALVSGLLAMAAAFAVLRVPGVLVIPALPVFLVGWAYLAVVMLAQENWLMPLAQPLAAIAIAIAGALSYRGAKRLRPRLRAA